ncbi:hypothetical protein IC762_12730 [Bradyrhizobium genosp. L]|uniref:hypothetical protein n=1 Tax=Bradyrhizobium genosp. L TaxID=83637 RepID=UPI0018A2701B|nr:hypothetical protein [Bradyrhizobium genosp. L]QPF87105.1 hypothetical protein IC762_12730 [Bradyrhizobium genosp. L]
MTKLALVIAAAAAVAYSSPSWCQGTKDNQSTQSQTSRGTGGSKPDPMGGAMKGTGTPNFGTSPGMGSDKKSQR